MLFGEPLGEHFAIKIDQKSMSKVISKTDVNFLALGSVLERFGVVWEAILVVKIMVFHWFLKGFVKINVFG